jgi:hypothetical protein
MVAHDCADKSVPKRGSSCRFIKQLRKETYEGDKLEPSFGIVFEEAVSARISEVRNRPGKHGDDFKAAPQRR